MDILIMLTCSMGSLSQLALYWVQSVNNLYTPEPSELHTLLIRGPHAPLRLHSSYQCVNATLPLSFRPKKVATWQLWFKVQEIGT
jgi:hypothetical protein